MKRIATLFTAALLLSTATATEGICRALALSGGGNKGAYEAGVITGLVQSLAADQVTWDVVSGVSAGALNAAGMAIFKKGEEQKMSTFLLNLCGNITTQDIWKEWPEGLVHGMFNESGIFDDTPLFNLLTKIFAESDGIQRKMVVAADDTRTGSYHTFDETTPASEIATAVISSASIPAVFPDRKYKDLVLMDGGTVWNTNLVSAVNKCVDMGFEKSQIVVDIAICGHSELESETKTGNTISNILRYRNIKHYYKSMDDILEYKNTEPTVNFRYLFVPSQPLAGGIKMLFFKPEIIQPMILLGQQDVQTMIQLKKSGLEMYEEWKNTSKLQKKYKHFHEYLYATEE